ncbi:class I SAM-dependent methyltransferase [Methanofollis aquaemaris]|uniref:Class I SAM-dependent methyltransferase n=1 Tax=Methanofollis aquaemaris TaxID=126734 RepID=A0A8A3S3J2_9EURY|nr:class I SAM-dependent methyltransferase [Methanofollis aquaemaris]QSZ66493.1 class I SAM-dependent methyltransferase [Methanofollis aquaemaris]
MEDLPDYNDLWRAAIESRQGEESDPGARWDKKAGAFDRMARADGVPVEYCMIGVRPDETVLDIGAGTGRLSVPFAREARHLTALDPSEQMLDRLRQHMAEAGLSNYTVLRERWEVAEVEGHDVVVGANVLGFADLRAALAKMDAAARRAVHLFWHAGEWREPDEMTLHRVVFGEDQWGYPDYLWVVHVLHEMRIYANVTIYGTEHTTRYASVDEAAAEWCRLHDAPDGSEATVRSHFARVLAPLEGGGYVLRRRWRMAMIWWEKGTGWAT